MDQTDPLHFPVGFFIERDDTAALRIIVGLGAGQKLLDGATFATGNSAWLTWDHHETHWLVLVRFHGYADPSENGYMVVGWPKTQFPASVMMEAIRSHAEESGSKIIGDEPEPDETSNN